jgi:tripartite-type tricarboxylate transporter receptor subunit TctC
MAKIDVNHVPYKGSSQVMTDLGSGEVQALFSSMPSLTGLADKGTIRAIGITAPSSSPGMKGLPVISESGLPGFSYTTWYGVFTAAGTPPAVIEQLSAALKTLGADETLRRRLDEQGVELQVGTPRELEVVTRKESAQWEKTIRAAHIELN